MPYLKGQDIRRLTGMRDVAEFELDVRGLDLTHSIASIEKMLERSRFNSPRTVIIRIDKPSEDSGETHFQPIARLLVKAIKSGIISKSRPITEIGGGFWIALAGKINDPKKKGP
ncbi:MAG: hypothetical protein CMM53_07735 [Rhodospirillaceae bacterium]|nr:hypothetical protein [Rhodospirillaceae bacterium]|tara:strand:- start:223 stop:564 length:342 start_codon:yes stop_codon:yes gene_type:complete